METKNGGYMVELGNWDYFSQMESKTAAYQKWASVGDQYLASVCLRAQNRCCWRQSSVKILCVLGYSYMPSPAQWSCQWCGDDESLFIVGPLCGIVAVFTSSFTLRSTHSWKRMQMNTLSPFSPRLQMKMILSSRQESPLSLLLLLLNLSFNSGINWD